MRVYTRRSRARLTSINDSIEKLTVMNGAHGGRHVQIAVSIMNPMARRALHYKMKICNCARLSVSIHLEIGIYA